MSEIPCDSTTLTSVLRMISPVVHIDFAGCAGYQYSEFVGVEHSQPFKIDHIAHALTKLQHLLIDLLVQLVVGHQMDILNAVFVRHGDVLPVGFQLDQLDQSGACFNERHEVHVAYLRLADLAVHNGEVQSEIFDVTVVVLQVEQVPVHFRIERSQMMNVDFSRRARENFLQEEGGERQLGKELLIDGLGEQDCNVRRTLTSTQSYLAQHSAEKVVVRSEVFIDKSNVRIRIQIPVTGQFEQATYGIEGRFQQLIHEFAKETTAVDARFIETDGVDETDTDLAPQVGL